MKTERKIGGNSPILNQKVKLQKVILENNHK